MLFDWWIFTVTTGGIKRAFFMVLRIMLLICGTLLLTYTTSPIALTDGLELLLNPLKKIKVPVHEMSMMMSMALRFIPTLIEETDKIMSAQKARGADFSTGRLTERARGRCCPSWCRSSSPASAAPTSSPWPWRAAATTAARGRTRMKTLKYARRDALAFLAGALVLGAMIAMKACGI